ncbi:hypothetical protein MUK42_37282 [Musa troglodytarum]|uniref:Uncharacterized protein n=1 Tax=Musa troglodytarum TaxID=320322 RepID=A0A9E7G6T1_9LILI|nr:hypothetical protein MUK42_37282 [Musa troglodytarum]
MLSSFLRVGHKDPREKMPAVLGDMNIFGRAVTEENQFMVLTFPSYSRWERTSGAMYAGLPTVDFGRE